MIKDLGLNHVQSASLFDVDAVVEVPSSVGRIEIRHRGSCVLPCILCQGARDRFHRLPKLADRILLQPGRLVGKVLELCCQAQLAGPSASNQPGILDNLLVDIHSILDRALKIVEAVGCRRPQNHGRDARLLERITRDGDAIRSPNLIHRHKIRLPNLFWQRCSKASKGSGASELADPSDLELGRALDDHELVALAKVQRHVADRRLRDQDVDSGLYNLPDALVHRFLLTLGIVHQLLSTLDKNIPLGFCC
mmetsp:Transcript_69763/g.145465  ORF Transcript_69763/g.145465 Transcript_69763/m.145465 type:complete len:251 (-) Transcript_69763:951-1703(-)